MADEEPTCNDVDIFRRFHVLSLLFNPIPFLLNDFLFLKGPIPEITEACKPKCVPQFAKYEVLYASHYSRLTFFYKISTLNRLVLEE